MVEKTIAFHNKSSQIVIGSVAPGPFIKYGNEFYEKYQNKTIITKIEDEENFIKNCVMAFMILYSYLTDLKKRIFYVNSHLEKNYIYLSSKSILFLECEKAHILMKLMVSRFLFQTIWEYGKTLLKIIYQIQSFFHNQ